MKSGCTYATESGHWLVEQLFLISVVGKKITKWIELSVKGNHYNKVKHFFFLILRQ